MTKSEEQFILGVERRDLRVGVVGLGYVGLPLLIEVAKAGFAVRGFDIDDEKIARLEAGQSYIRHIPSAGIAALDGQRVDYTTDFKESVDCDAILICVPTPLTAHQEPDLTYILSTADKLGPYVKRGQLIVLESTTFPGTTRDVLAPRLSKLSGLNPETDFHMAYSPEREDPNNKDFSTRTIPKVVGGMTEVALRMADALYRTVICQTVPVSSCEVAEATKLMENIFRCVNIALVNELKTVFHAMDIDVWEVVNAAKTKPFGYMPFYPGPGLGGHCIPIDPFYLTWKAKEYGIATRFIELAGAINTDMPNYVVERTMRALNEHGKAVRGSRIILIGLSYKANIDDIRESPSFVLWRKLEELGATLDYFDPYCDAVPRTRDHPQFAGIKSKTMADIEAGGYDAALIATGHDNVDYAAISRSVTVVIDTRNVAGVRDNVVKA
ncbi:MAG: nucleotide sugar dehydrogenase [Acidobacteria bacterium]|nr:nucleotide sugar dehydrogenase [Acidobacteriota bacterium]